MICALYGGCQIVQAPFIPTAYIEFRNTMSTSQNSVANPFQIDFDIFGADINQHNFKPLPFGIQHHLQIVLA